MAVQIQLRRDTAADWSSENPVLALGEMGFETDTLRYKLGDGVTAWNSLTYGVFDGFTSGRRYSFDDTITDSDPGAGNLRFNHATFASITHLYFDNADAAGGTATAWLDALDNSSDPDNKGTLFIQKQDDPNVYREFVVGGAVVDGTGYRKVPVAPLTENGALSDGDALVVAFYRTGASGTLSTSGPKATPVDADKVAILDSEDFDATKTLSWANLKAALAGLFVRHDAATALSTSAQAQARANISAPLNGHIFGLTVSNNASDANNLIDIAAGTAADVNNTVLMTLASGLTKGLNAAWAVGNNQGMLDAASKAADTWYHIFLIQRSDTGVVDILASTSLSSPVMPTNYDRRRNIMSILTDGSSNILAFIQDGGSVQWKTPRLAFSDTAPGTSAKLDDIDVPLGMAVWASCTAMVSNDTDKTAVYFTDPAQTDSALSLGVGPLPQVRNSVNAVSQVAQFSIRTNASRQIRYRFDASSPTAVVRVQTNGFIHPRGGA